MNDLIVERLGVAPQPDPFASRLPAKNLGYNGSPDNTFWFQSGLSLFTESRDAPPAFLERLEEFCVPGSNITTGDMVIFYRGADLHPSKKIGEKLVINSRSVQVIRFGVAYEDDNNQIRVISQDEHGNVWDHSLEELPQYQQDDWDFYGLRIPAEQTTFKPDSRYPRPNDVIDAWLPLKHQ